MAVRWQMIVLKDMAGSNMAYFYHIAVFSYKNWKGAWKCHV